MLELITQSLPTPVDHPLEELDSLAFMDFVFKLEDKLEVEHGIEISLLDNLDVFRTIPELENYLCGLTESK